MNGVGVVAALAAEARTLGRLRQISDGVSVLEDGRLVGVSGMGDAAAELGARRLIEAGATSLMSFGMAGGLDPALSAGRIVLPRTVISSSGARFETAAGWRENLGAVISAHNPLTGGTLLTSATAIDSVADKAAALRETGAVAVDMESVAVAQMALKHRLPFIAVRVIVDTASDALPRSVVAASRSGQVQLWRLLAGLVLAPAELGGMIRLSQRYRIAIHSLRVVAQAEASAPQSGLRSA